MYHLHNTIQSSVCHQLHSNEADVDVPQRALPSIGSSTNKRCWTVHEREREERERECVCVCV
jgi:hypothetical protein